MDLLEVLSNYGAMGVFVILVWILIQQVLNEANRVRDRRKFLCTLQQGISEPQLDEMESEKLTLVVPKKYISSYPRTYQNKIWTIEQFIDFIKKTEGK